MHVRELIVSPETQSSYSPAAHRGTVNRRLISRDTVGAAQLEVNLGVLAPDGEAEPHFHSKSEQAVYILEGHASVEVFGETAALGPGQVVFFPPGVRHKITVASETPVKCLVMYAPPLPDATTAFETD